MPETRTPPGGAADSQWPWLEGLMDSIAESPHNVTTPCPRCHSRNSLYRDIDGVACLACGWVKYSDGECPSSRNGHLVRCRNCGRLFLPPIPANNLTAWCPLPPCQQARKAEPNRRYNCRRAEKKAHGNRR